MKTSFLIAIPAMVVLVASCTIELDNPALDEEIVAPVVDETQQTTGEVLTVVARVGESDDTKTAIQSDGTSIYWTEGDAINLFYGSGSAGQFTTAITEPAAVAEFTGTLSVATGSNEVGHEAKAFWAIYPYNVANTCDGTGVTLTIPGAQESIAGSFADKLNPTVATSPGLDLTFFNVGSWFIFSVTQEGVTAAIFEGNNNESVAGTVRVTMDESSRPSATVQNGIKRIVITPGDGETFTVGELYYIVVIPQTLENGYTLTLKKGTLSAKCVVSNSATFTRSMYRRKRNADNEMTYEFNSIVFQDDNVKSTCVTRWDLDGDGELSYDEAALVTNVSFQNNTSITSFDELQYFTSLESINFSGCTALESITLPDHLASINGYCFNNCTSLQELILPSSIERLGNYAFSNCSARVVLQSDLADIWTSSNQVYPFTSYSGELLISEGVTTIPQQVFAGSSPTTITIPSTIESVGDWAFSGCSAGIAYINCNIPSFDEPWEEDEYINWANGNWFANNSFSRVVFGDNVTTIGDYGMYQSRGLTDLVVGNGVTTIGKYAFAGCSHLENLRLGSSLETLAERTFSYAFHNASSTPIITISATVAPTIDRYTFEEVKRDGTLNYPSGADYSTWLVNDYGRLGYYGWRPSGYVRVTSISLNSNSLSLPIGYTGTLSATILPNNANNKTVIWTSSDASIASVSNGVVTANTKGQATIIATCEDNGMYSQCSVTVTDYVDMGLSVKWGTCNIGASSPEGYGYAYAWGEITPKNSFSWANYKWCNGTYTSLTKYNDDYQYGYVDMKYTLDSSDDVATVTLGSGYKIPSSQQWQELLDYSTWTETTRNGIAGFLVTSTVAGYTDKYIFLPLSGLVYDITDPQQDYWSSTMPRHAAAVALVFTGEPGSYTPVLGNVGKCNGYRVRSVFVTD